MKRTTLVLAAALLAAAPVLHAADGIAIACDDPALPPLQVVADLAPGMDPGHAYATREHLMRVARRACKQQAARLARRQADADTQLVHVQPAPRAPLVAHRGQ